MRYALDELRSRRDMLKSLLGADEKHRLDLEVRRTQMTGHLKETNAAIETLELLEDRQITVEQIIKVSKDMDVPVHILVPSFADRGGDNDRVLYHGRWFNKEGLERVLPKGAVILDEDE